MSDRLRESLTGVVLDATTTFTLVEFCRACGVDRRLVVELVEEGVIEPVARSGDWEFAGESLVRARRAIRIVQDLDVNLPGAALALDLLEQIDALRAGMPPRHR